MLVARRKSDQAIYPDFQSNAAPGMLSAAAVASGFATVNNIEEINVDQATFDGYVQAAYGAIITANAQARSAVRARVVTLLGNAAGTPIESLTAAEQKGIEVAICYLLGIIDNTGVIQPLANWLAN